MKIFKCAFLCCCFNRKQTTLNFFETFQNAINEIDNIFFEFYLLDDGDDGTGNLVLKKFKNLKVKLYNGDGNNYWNGGMRFLMKQIKKKNFDFFIFINDDVLLEGNSIKTLLDTYFKHKKDKIVISGKFVSSKNNKITYGLRDSNYEFVTSSIDEPFYLNGNLVLFPFKVISEIGILSKKYTHGLGDWDYGLKLKKVGYQLLMTEEISGGCDSNSIPIWFNPKFNVIKRIKSFYKTKKMNLGEQVYFSYYHFGLVRAIKTLFAICINILSPNFYRLLKK